MPPIVPDVPKPPKPKPPIDTTPYDKGIKYQDIVSRAAGHEGHIHRSGKCQQFAEESITGSGGLYGSAREFYDWSKKGKYLQTSAPPAGVPVFYQGSSKNNYGHVAVSAGGGYVYSTDANGNKVGKVPYNKLWGGTGSGTYLGWSPAVKTKKGGVSYINYDTTTVGKAPTVKVRAFKESGSSSSPSPTPSPSPSMSDIDTTPMSEAPGTVNLSSLTPGSSPQFSGVASQVPGTVTIPKVG